MDLQVRLRQEESLNAEIRDVGETRHMLAPRDCQTEPPESSLYIPLHRVVARVPGAGAPRARLRAVTVRIKHEPAQGTKAPPKP